MNANLSENDCPADPGKRTTQSGSLLIAKLPEEARDGGAAWMRCPGWLRSFLGSTLLRSCPSRRECSNTRCHLRVLCNCAAKDLAAAAKVEMRVWGILLFCGLAGILYWFLGQ